MVMEEVKRKSRKYGKKKRGNREMNKEINSIEETRVRNKEGIRVQVKGGGSGDEG